MYNDYDSTLDYKSQVANTIRKAQRKKGANEKIIAWLVDRGEHKRAENIRQCATMLGFTEIDRVAHVVKANFCRERICSVCAWRRQSKFVAQMLPVLDYLEKRTYRFLFATLTIKNVTYGNLGDSIDLLMCSYDKLLHRKKIKKAWLGVARSLEVTYNSETDSFHPHIHLLIAVAEDYFTTDELYITQSELTQFWKESAGLDYFPQCDIRAVKGNEDATLETFKYALKPSKNEKALEGFFYALKGRRLISFSGVFAKARKLFNYSSFEEVLTDDLPVRKNSKFECILYKFDVTGGVYNFYDKLYFER